MEKTDLEILSVSQFLALVNQTLSYAYPLMVIEGEVSSFKINQNKWVFFDLKDSDSLVSCFMSIYQLKVALEDGMLVRVTASVNITKWGKFSLTVKNIELSGEGSIKKSFELLKAKFDKEGLFDEARKRSLPRYPQKIALITSAQAAAFNDFKKIIDQRWSGLCIDHAQVQVQGSDANMQIIRAIEYFNEKAKQYDVMVIIRGGGSLEDLQVFSSEDVVRSIYASRIITLVGIGHEDDVSLAELASDKRAATPTDAARLLTIDKKEQLGAIDDIVKFYSHKLLGSVENDLLIIRSLNATFANLYDRFYQSLKTLKQDVANLVEKNFQQTSIKIDNLARLVSSMNPRKLLAKGYSIARVNDQIIKSADEVEGNDMVVLQLHKGKLNLRKSND
jgi:exodeoxyribonuclease VII large subunit